MAWGEKPPWEQVRQKIARLRVGVEDGVRIETKGAWAFFKDLEIYFGASCAPEEDFRLGTGQLCCLTSLTVLWEAVEFKEKVGSQIIWVHIPSLLFTSHLTLAL